MYFEETENPFRLTDILKLAPHAELNRFLIKHYLKLGGKFLGFNVDDRFSNVLDGLILVDLVRTDIRLLRKYMGPENAQSFTDYHKSCLVGRPRVS